MPRSKALVTFMLALAMVMASVGLILFSGATAAEEAPSLTVVATLSAFVIALCFRQLGSLQKPGSLTPGRITRDRRLLTAALVIAMATLLADARIVIRYRSSPDYPSNPFFKH